MHKFKLVKILNHNVRVSIIMFDTKRIIISLSKTNFNENIATHALFEYLPVNIALPTHRIMSIHPRSKYIYHACTYTIKILQIPFHGSDI